MLPGVVARARLSLPHRFSLIADASYGVLMLGHHTRVVLLAAGGQYAVTTTAWLRDIAH